MSKFLLVLGKLYPQNFFSFLLGALVRVKIPFISPLLNKLFVLVFRINMEEAEKSIEDYGTIEDVFTRALKPDARSAFGELTSPADGTWSQAGALENGSAIQAKGLYYDPIELVYGPSHDLIGAEPPKFSSFATIYLAPHNYHRVHSPVGGTLERIRYIPGELWPVNEPFVKWLPKLFTRNERLIFDIALEGGGKVHAVMVGALNVGRMVSPFLEGFASNDYFNDARAKLFEMDEKVSLKPGDELGTFMLGSTVVLVFDDLAEKKLPSLNFKGKSPIKMGESLN